MASRLEARDAGPALQQRQVTGLHVPDPRSRTGRQESAMRGAELSPSGCPAPAMRACCGTLTRGALSGGTEPHCGRCSRATCPALGGRAARVSGGRPDPLRGLHRANRFRGGTACRLSVSLWQRPFVTCRRCNGTGRVSGTLFFWSRGFCMRCGGTGLCPRLGTLLLDALTRRQPQPGFHRLIALIRSSRGRTSKIRAAATGRR